jgi:hypothetical protein
MPVVETSRQTDRQTNRQTWKQELLNNKWQHINEEIALSKIITAKNATEQRNLGTLAYKIK